MTSIKEYSKFTDFIERVPITGALKAIYHYLNGDIKKSKICLIKQFKFVINLLKILPGIGHSMGLLAYIFQQKEAGDIYIKSSSRTLLCGISGLVYGYFVNKSYQQIFHPLKISKELVFSAVLGLFTGVLFDYSTSFEKSLKLSHSHSEKSERYIMFPGKEEILVSFPFGMIKYYKRLYRKPAKRPKYMLRIALNSFLYGLFGCIGMYYCLKLEKSLYEYVIDEFKQYALMGTCLLFLFL